MSGGGPKLTLGAGLSKSFLVALLFAVMLWVPQLHSVESALNPESMMTLGFIVLAAFTLGEIAETIKLPHITAYLVTGMLCGPEAHHVLHVPEALNVLDHETIQDLKLFDQLAVALIALSAGGALSLESLRKGFKLLGITLVAQFLALLGVLAGLVFLLSGVIPGFSLPFLEGQSMRVIGAAAILLALVGAAQSPAASIAIINESRSKGPLTDTVLGVSVLNNVVVVVLFGVGSALAFGWMPDAHAAAVPLWKELSVQMGASVALAGGIAAGAVAWKRFTNTSMMLPLTALCFLVTWAATELGQVWIGKPIDPLLAFLGAGFLVRNWGGAHAPLNKTIETLSMPVYVVFFFLAGANLHLHALVEMFAFAGVLFAGRLVALWLGTAGGAVLASGPSSLRTFGFLGFGAQAGIALAMAGAVEHGAGEVGASIGTLAVAGIALNELFGPILLKLSLGWANEVPKDDAHAAHDAPAAVEPEAPPERMVLPGEPPGFDPWGPDLDLPSRRLNALSHALRRDLQHIARDVHADATAARKQSGLQLLAQLRREFLRMHRHLVVASQSPTLTRAEFTSQIRRELGQLARRWESHLLDRGASATFRVERSALVEMVKQVDALVEALPQALEVPLEPSLLDAAEGDGPALRGRLVTARVSRGLQRGDGRVVDVRPLARWSLSGQVPLHLGELAGLMALTERQLLERSRSLFEALRRNLDALSEHPDFEPGSWTPLLADVRAELEEEFALAVDELSRLVEETDRVAAAALGRPLKTFNHLVRIAGTPRLRPGETRYSRAYGPREQAMADLDAGLKAARDLTRGVSNGLAMELQLLRLRLEVRETVELHTAQLSKDLHGRVTHQIARVLAALDTSLPVLSDALAQPNSADDLVQALKAQLGPLLHLVEEALGVAQAMRTSLQTETAIEPLRDGLILGVDALTDHFQVVERAPGLAGRRLPPPPTLRDVPFRDLASQYLDAEVGRDLSLTVEELLASVDDAMRAAEELLRSLQFNQELALTELAVVGPVPEPVREVVRAAVVDTAERMRGRLGDVHATLEQLGPQAAEQIQSVVFGHIDAFHDLLVEGRWDEVRRRLQRGQVERRRQLITGGASNLVDLTRHMNDGLRMALGEASYQSLRRKLGVPTPGPTGPLRPAEFAQVVSRVALPVVFTRLFTDPALEAADLLMGRGAELQTLRQLLVDPTAGRTRGVAVLGQGPGRMAAINAMLRGLSDQLTVQRHTLTGPASVDEVEAILDQAGDGHAVVVDGLHWLFRVEPGGFEPLRRLLQGVMDDRGRCAWIVGADPQVWAYANRVAPLAQVFSGRLELATLSPANLRRAVLARHAMSGYTLRFARPQTNVAWWMRETFRRQTRTEQAYEEHVFARLHELTGGVLSDAMRLWMGSVVEVDPATDTIVVGACPGTPHNALRALDEHALLTLRQLTRQGRLQVDLHARTFRLTHQESNAELTRLTHLGILVHGRNGYRLADHLRASAARVLIERGLSG
jgi:Kef-type K+ transport system membrane component KefB